MIKPGEEILVGNGRRLRVLDVVRFDEEDESPFVGCYRSRTPWGFSRARVPGSLAPTRLVGVRRSGRKPHLSSAADTGLNL
jgi:hypothetical protein